MRSISNKKTNMELDSEKRDLVERIDKALKYIEGERKVLNAGESLIVDNIRSLLDEKNIKYKNEESDPKTIQVHMEEDNKPFDISVFHQGGKINYRLDFPFRVQTNAIAIIAIFIGKYNERKAFSTLNLNTAKGELYMQYSYICQHIGDFNDQIFWMYFMSIIEAACDVYSKLSQLSVGKIRSKENYIYGELMRQSMHVLLGTDDDEIMYGSECIEDEDVGLTEEMKDELYSVFDSDNWDIYSYDELDEKTKRSIPAFEDFIRITHGMVSESHDEDDGDGDINIITYND